mgnify:CR=1 FL=1
MSPTVLRTLISRLWRLVPSGQFKNRLGCALYNLRHNGFRIRFDAMNAVTGPYAVEILERRFAAMLMNTERSARAMRHVASILDMTPAEVEDVATYYVMFFRAPVGKFVLQVCRTLSCALNGAERKVSDCDRRTAPTFSWTPDGRGLIFGSMVTETGSSGLRILDLTSILGMFVFFAFLRWNEFSHDPSVARWFYIVRAGAIAAVVALVSLGRSAQIPQHLRAALAQEAPHAPPLELAEHMLEPFRRITGTRGDAEARQFEHGLRLLRLVPRLVQRRHVRRGPLGRHGDGRAAKEQLRVRITKPRAGISIRPWIEPLSAAFG